MLLGAQGGCETSTFHNDGRVRKSAREAKTACQEPGIAESESKQPKLRKQWWAESETSRTLSQKTCILKTGAQVRDALPSSLRKEAT